MVEHPDRGTRARELHAADPPPPFDTNGAMSKTTDVLSALLESCPVDLDSTDVELISGHLVAHGVRTPGKDHAATRQGMNPSDADVAQWALAVAETAGIDDEQMAEVQRRLAEHDRDRPLTLVGDELRVTLAPAAQARVQALYHAKELLGVQNPSTGECLEVARWIVNSDQDAVLAHGTLTNLDVTGD